jgi:hypothetical protein
MQTRPLIFGLLANAVLLLAGCVAIPTGSDRYLGANFGTYHSYAWISSDPLIKQAGAPQDVSALTVRRIRDAIEAELAAKHYKKVDATSSADFVVAITVGTRDRLTAESYPVPYRGPWTWEWRESGVDVHTFVEGTLSIDIFDSTSKQPVWHGWATKVITDSDRENPAPMIQRGVAKVLRDFPTQRN